MAASSWSSSSAVSAMVVVVLIGVIGRAEATLKEECSQGFSNLAMCLEYATGKAAKPTKDCCGGIEGIKESKPECLCFIIQQTHSGNSQAKSLGIKEANLLQLPSACNMKNASLSNCPNLLGLSPDSPDRAIFSSNATTTPATTAPSTTSTTATPASGTHDIVTPFSSLAMTVLAIVLFVFTTSNI